MVPLLIFQDMTKRISDLDSSDCRTVFHFASVHFKWALVQTKDSNIQHRVHIWFLLLMLELWPTFLHVTVNCVHRHWFLEVFLSPCSDFHNKFMPVFNSLLPKGPKTTWIHYWFWVVFFLTEMSPHSLNHFIYVFYFRWWNIQSHRILSWGKLLFHYL